MGQLRRRLSGNLIGVEVEEEGTELRRSLMGKGAVDEGEEEEAEEEARGRSGDRRS